MKFLSLSSVVGLLASSSSVLGAFEQVSDFGDNPTSIQMFTYVPSNLATNPPVIVAASSSIPGFSVSCLPGKQTSQCH